MGVAWGSKALAITRYEVRNEIRSRAWWKLATLLSSYFVLLTSYFPVSYFPIQTSAAGLDERTLISHDFTTTAQGWLISGDTGLTAPEFNATLGNPGGCISNIDEALGETWYFRAPDSVLQQLSAAEQGTLSFDLEQSADEPGFLDDDIVIVGPAGRLSYRFRSSPGTSWTPFSVRLSASAGWRWNWNAPATQEQIRRVLQDPTSLEIRGEYHTGPDIGRLDNVVLKTGA
ncbi:MAG: laminin B domain-containing protein [Vicinamibacterales bacterium]